MERNKKPLITEDPARMDANVSQNDASLVRLSSDVGIPPKSNYNDHAEVQMTMQAQTLDRTLQQEDCYHMAIVDNMNFVEAEMAAPNDCALAPVYSLTDLAQASAVTGNRQCWIGIEKPGVQVGDPASVGDWFNVADGSAVPSQQTLWKQGEPNNSVGAQSHATVNFRSNGKLRDVQPTDIFPCAVYKCCEALATSSPTGFPTSSPTNAPTSPPTNVPTSSPTNVPTSSPTNVPTSSPTNVPTVGPTMGPTLDNDAVCSEQRYLPLVVPKTLGEILSQTTASTCVSSKPFPGSRPGDFLCYDFTTINIGIDNPGLFNPTLTEQCVSISVTAQPNVMCKDGDFTVATYQESLFDPGNLQSGYIADSGSTALSQAFSFRLLPSQAYEVFVLSMNPFPLGCLPEITIHHDNDCVSQDVAFFARGEDSAPRPTPTTTSPTLSPIASPTAEPTSSPTSSPESSCTPYWTVINSRVNFMGAVANTPNGCSVAPVHSIDDLVEASAVTGGNQCWIGISKPSVKTGDPAGVDGWTNVNDGSPVPADSGLWKSKEPNNSVGAQTHATVNYVSSGKLRDVQATDYFSCTVYKCC